MQPPAPPSSRPVAPQLRRWASASNSRRVAEELLAGAAAVAAASLVALGLSRLPTAATHLGFDWSAAAGALQIAGWIVIGVAAGAMVARAVVRYRRLRTDARHMARRLDHHHDTRDLFATALAVEAGGAHGNEGLEAIVSSRAATQLPSVRAPINGFEAPLRAFAAVGMAAALVALLPTEAAADPEGVAAASEDDTVTAPPLDEETLEALKARAKELERLEYTPGLADDAREQLADARARLEQLGEDPDRSLSELARAQKALEDLEQRARRGDLHDPSKLERMNTSELAEQMTRAIDRGETDTAAAMAEELSRRLDEAEQPELDRAARALERALRRSEPGERASGRSSDASTPADESDAASSSRSREGSEGAPADASESPRSGSGSEAPSRAESESRARERNRVEELAENLRDGDSGSARAGLEDLAESMRERAGSQSLERSLGEAAEDIRRARERQLSEMNGEGEGKGEGQGEGEGEGQAGGERPSESPGTAPGAPGEGEGPGNGPGEGEGDGEGEGESAGGPGADGASGDEAPRIAPPLGGRPGGKPGPGGGDGADDTKGGSKTLPRASMHGAERVQARPTGPAQGSVRAIRRYSEGYRDSRDYKDLHDKYECIAESAVRREEIPLTRRDYIRSYFQAVRGR